MQPNSATHADYYADYVVLQFFNDVNFAGPGTFRASQQSSSKRRSPMITNRDTFPLHMLSPLLSTINIIITPRVSSKESPSIPLPR